MIRGNILTIGPSTIELRISTPYTTSSKKKMLEAERYKFSASGRGANIAIGIARLGWGSMLCTALGEDMFGRTFGRIFADERVESRYIKTCRNAQTSINFSFENKNGEIYIPASTSSISPTDVEASFDVMPDAVITTLELPFSVVSTACRCVSTQDTKFILDATGAREDMDLSSLKKLCAIVLSDNDLSVLTGVEIKSIDDRMNGCIKLNSKLDVKYTIVDMGEKGYYLYDGKYCDFVMPWDMPFVDENGCREAFISAFTIGFLRTDDVKASVDFAAASCAISRSAKGGFESLPTERAIRELMKK